ncbi:MAG: carbohydrate kinase, partial [Rhodospirillaceae bacterium]|nr:carbohydrate kinase [Rhodospirillaceae bacterium]
ELAPADWGRALGVAVPKALAAAGAAPTEIAAICIDTTCCSVVALDGQGEALRPALIWMDVRSAPQAARVAGCGDPALAVNGAGAGPVSAEWMIPKALWLMDNEPETFARARTVCEFQDYMNLHLAGRLVASINNVSVRWHYRARAGGYARTMLQRLGAEALLEKWPVEVVPLGQVIGGLTRRAARHLGLPEGLPVVQGGADAFIAMIGLGVVEPDRLALITGSSHLQLGLSRTELHGKGIFGTYADAVIPGLHVVEGGQISTGSIIAWFNRLIGGAADYEALNREAAALPPGAEGLIVLDHFQGNRTPYTDAVSRGVISGLTLKHGPAHVFRAIMEGVAYGTALIFDTMRANGYAPRQVMICGGSTRSPLWLQIHADVTGVPMTVTEVTDAPILGCAILAAVGAGLHPDISAAAARMVRVARTVEPDPAMTAAYRPFYEAYRDTYPALADILHRQAAAAGGGS